MLKSKKLIYISVLCVVLGMIVSLSLFYRINFLERKEVTKNPPSLTVLYKDNSIKTIRGSFSWATKNKKGKIITAINADTVGPTELVKDSAPLFVSPKSILTLNFSDKPLNFKVNIWHGSETIKQETTEYKLKTPESKGSVIYEVVANWDDGTACYAFLVNVD